MSPPSARWNSGLVRMVPANPVIHWVNKEGAECGAPAGVIVSPYAHAVTCRECVIKLRIDTLERPLQAHRHAVALGRIRPIRPAR